MKVCFPGVVKWNKGSWDGKWQGPNCQRFFSIYFIYLFSSLNQLVGKTDEWEVCLANKSSAADKINESGGEATAHTEIILSPIKMGKRDRSVGDEGRKGKTWEKQNNGEEKKGEWHFNLCGHTAPGVQPSAVTGAGWGRDHRSAFKEYPWKGQLTEMHFPAATIRMRPATVC